ncbi:MAG: OapA family protein [Thiohalomonadaceae bacterium]
MNYSNNFNRDHKTGAATAGAPLHKRHRKHIHALAVVSLIIGLLALLAPSHEASATREPVLPGIQTLDLALPDFDEATKVSGIGIAELPSQAELPWESVTVRAGDSLSVIFDHLKLSPQQLLAVVNADQKNKILTRLRPGQVLQFQINDQQLQAIRFDISSEKSLLVSRSEEGFSSQFIEHPIEVRTSHVHGEISNSLFLAGQQAGLSDNIIMELANIFGWDVDFALDIRSGDSFSLLFEEHYLDGEKLRDGRILAAEFYNRGRNFQAVLFTDTAGRSQYYSPDGKSMRKAFLRSPVDFRRISSTFQRERFHPVLGERRPHRGVDYAAATGTPIKAAGDGRVIFRGVQGGYGNTVIIQHGNNITTLYAHMSRFQQGVTNGSRVRQGQTIGYVGMTGLATGPHLHYEFRVNGLHHNPLTVTLPDADPIPAKYREQFKQQSQPLLAQLNQLNRVQVASSAR